MASKGLFYHEEVTAPIRVAQVLGLTASAYLCGHTASATYLCIPSFLQAPAPLLAKQWQQMIRTDLEVGPAIAAFGALTFGFLAYKEPLGSTASTLYLTSSILLPSTVLYAVLFLKPINEILLAKAQSLDKDPDATSLFGTPGEGRASNQSVHELVDRWATVNLGRALLSGIGAVLAVWAAVDRVEVVGASLGSRSGADRLG